MSENMKTIVGTKHNEKNRIEKKELRLKSNPEVIIIIIQNGIETMNGPRERTNAKR
jgi:hypothetical protein